MLRAPTRAGVKCSELPSGGCLRHEWAQAAGDFRAPRGVAKEETMPVIRPPPHHVTMRTSRLDEMLAWYGRLIGARVMFRNEHAAWLTNDEANNRVAFLAVPGLSDDPQKTNHNGMHHLAFEYTSFSDLITSHKRLSDEGVSPS